MRHLYIGILLLLFSHSIRAQPTTEEGQTIDSLNRVVNSSSSNIEKVRALQQWDNLIYSYDADLDFKLNLQIDSLASITLKEQLSPEERKEVLQIKAFGLNNIGLIRNSSGDSPNALEAYIEALDICQSNNFLKQEASILNNIGTIYLNQKDYIKALEYYERNLDIRLQLKDKKGELGALSNLGVTYNELGDTLRAEKAYHECLKKSLKMNEPYSITAAYVNLGGIHFDYGHYDSALVYFENALYYAEPIGDILVTSEIFINVAKLYLKKFDFNNAESYGLKAFDQATAGNSKSLVKDASETLSEVYRFLGRHEEALEMYTRFVELKDSLNSEETRNSILRQEYQYAYDQQLTQDSIVRAAEKKHAESLLKSEKEKRIVEGERDRQLRYFLIGALLLAFVFGIIVFNRFRLTKKQKDIINLQKISVEEQKQKVDEAFGQLAEKNTEILDSINYAKRIQSAILPPDKLVKQYLENSFVLYKPKDIVAGDFYWLEEKNGAILFAAADCTGHGVPGAMVSVVCNNGLNRSVREYNLTNPGLILDKTREIVLEEFRAGEQASNKSEEEVKDGMDIALCSLNGRTLKFAGAHNPLWVIRHGGIEIEELKADKQPIGKYTNPQPYTTHEVQLNPGDSIYIFSDGFADQFGGEKGKKLKSKNFKALLLSIQDKPMSEQHQILEGAFEKWRGKYEQLDDVCVIGVRV